MTYAPRRGAVPCTRGRRGARQKPCPARACRSTRVCSGHPPPPVSGRTGASHLPPRAHWVAPGLISPLLPQIGRANSTSSYISHDPGSEFSGPSDESAPGTSSPRFRFSPSSPPGNFHGVLVTHGRRRAGSQTRTRPSHVFLASLRRSFSTALHFRILFLGQRSF